MRIRWIKDGGQRKFLKSVIDKMNISSLRGLLQFGFDVNYSTLKNYYNESRLIPKGLVEDFCSLSGIDFENLDVQEVEENWGRVKGGKVERR